MTHDDALALVSAVADGEAATTPDLERHLETCAPCAAFADDLARLSTLAAALPRPKAPEALARNVSRRISRRRWAFRAVPALAAATAVVVVATTLPGPGTALVPLPPAAAAEPLLSLRSLYVERTVTSGSVVTKERIWWRAPGYVRIERSGTEPVFDPLVIETPTLRYAEGVRTRDPVPAIVLPEPLSPTVALVGRDFGPGPAVAGLPTRIYEVVVDGEVRTAYVAGGIHLGGRESLVVSKMGSGGTRKTTTRLDLNPDLPDSLFVPPAAPETDGGFRARPVGDLRIEPDALPEGFGVLRSGSGPEGEALLLVRGSLPVLVRAGGLLDTGPSETRTIGGHLVSVALYESPSVQVTTGDGVVVTVSAPLPPESLVALARAMYGLE